MALAVAVLVAHLQRGLRDVPHPEGAARGPAPWLMGIGWVVAAIMLGALAAGYVAFAAFVAERIIVSLVVVAAAAAIRPGLHGVF